MSVNNEAIIVDGLHTDLNREEHISYSIKLVCRNPADVVLILTINERIHGLVPFNNLIKAQTRIDPDHAAGPEKQIQELRLEVAKARAEKYDWQAKAMQLEEKIKELIRENK